MFDDEPCSTERLARVRGRSRACQVVLEFAHDSSCDMPDHDPRPWPNEVSSRPVPSFEVAYDCDRSRVRRLPPRRPAACCPQKGPCGSVELIGEDSLLVELGERLPDLRTTHERARELAHTDRADANVRRVTLTRGDRLGPSVLVPEISKNPPHRLDRHIDNSRSRKLQRAADDSTI